MPDLLLLNLNMPKKDGRRCIQEIRSQANLKHIPIVVLSTSGADKDVRQCYQIGVNSFMQKPSNFDDLVALMTNLAHYWFNSVKLVRHGKTA